MLLQKGYSRINKGLLVLLSGLLLSACSEGDRLEHEAAAAAATAEAERVVNNARIVAGAPSDLNELLRFIREQASEPHASHPSSCHLVPVGQKPCGGPERFIVVSSETADVELVTQLAEAYTFLQAQQSNSDDVSNCQVIEPPVLNVVAGMCVPMRGERY